MKELSIEYLIDNWIKGYSFGINWRWLRIIFLIKGCLWSFFEKRVDANLCGLIVDWLSSKKFNIFEQSFSILLIIKSELFNNTSVFLQI